jgi:hypothetical protein
MANALNRNLKPGDRVILKNNGKTFQVAWLTFGCFSITEATEIMVRTQWRSKTFRISGMEIDAQATIENYSKLNGWTEHQVNCDNQ